MLSYSGSHIVGLRSDGTAVAAGSNYYRQCDVSGWTDVVAVSTDFGYYIGRGFTLGLKSDGTVLMVGDTSDGKNRWASLRDLAVPG